MRARATATFLLLSIGSFSPARSQTIVDTLQQLRSTFGQLRAKPAPSVSTSGGPSATTMPSVATDQGDGGLMVPASVLTDDPSDSALERGPMVQRRVETFDIRGFRLGMSPREVGRVAERQHFRRRWNSLLLTSGTFEVEATRLANARLNRPVERSSKVQVQAVQGVDPGGDVVTCEFTLEPSGPRVSRISYKARLNGTTRTQAIEALVAKYGRRSKSLNADDLIWKNSDRLVDNASPELIAVVDDNVINLDLTQSAEYTQNAKKMLADRANQIASAKGAGVKF